MAVFKQVIPVNNGNTGWNNGDVIEALETAFANLGWHSGTKKTGVIKTISPPLYENYAGSGVSGWGNQLSAIPINAAVNDKTWDITNNDSSSYVFSQTAGAGNQNGENIDIICNQGDTLTFNIDAIGHPFYIVWDNSDGYVEGTEIDGDYSSYPTAHPESEGIIPFLSTASIKSLPSGQGVESGTITWYTSEVVNRTYYYVCGAHGEMTGKIIINPNPGVHTNELTLYNLKSDEYNQLYRSSNVTYGSGPHRVYYDYTVPASGTRSAATFRIYRSQYGRISDVEILNARETYGWTNQEVFTIPGDAIGGSTPTHDLVFGVKDNTTPEIVVETYGSGLEFFQKNLDEGWAVLRLEHDASKRFGRTYHTFNIPSSNYRIYLNNGWDWIRSNVRVPYSYDSSYGPGGTSSSSTNVSWREFDTPGYFPGVAGVDINALYGNINHAYVRAAVKSIGFCRTTNPTSYPLELRVYKAQTPQDANFAVLQFTQTVNGSIETFDSFYLQKGNLWGSGIWDLNHSFQGGVGKLSAYADSSDEQIDFRFTGVPGIYHIGYYSNDFNIEETADVYKRVRECSYGYDRDRSISDPWGKSDRYASNMYTNNDENAYQESIIYYRNYDADIPTNSSVRNSGHFNMNAASTNFFKVIKGLPVNKYFVPQPYYLPDDFVLVQYAFPPGETIVATGDTITISPTESYEVIIASNSYNTFVPGFGNCTRGIAFCARK